MDVILANPRGFCAGVDRAIEIVERALILFGAPIYVRHEVVHNRFVVEDLRAKGAVFVEEVDQVPDGETIIFSAHGVAPTVREQAKQRGLKIFDATCPLVTKVHMEVVRHQKAAREVVLIGHAGHPEVEGTLGQYNPNAEQGGIYLVENEADVAKLIIKNPDNLAYVTQTTLSMDDTRGIVDTLRMRFPNIAGLRKADICYATQNRQESVKNLASKCDVVLVVGSPNSSNSRRLREVSDKMGTPAYLIDNEHEIDLRWFDNKTTIGVTAGASAPEILVERVVTFLKTVGVTSVCEDAGKAEKVEFPLPKAMQ